MTQAQAAGSPGPESLYPRPGEVLRDFVLLSAAGKPVQLSDYRGRANLVLLLAGAQPGGSGRALLHALAARYAQVLEEEAQVMAVLCCTREQVQVSKSRARLPFLVLADPDGALHRKLGALDARGAPRLAVYITDRFAEVFAAFRTAQGDPAPTVDGILGWLEFINRQCPECFPPEWPA